MEIVKAPAGWLETMEEKHLRQCPLNSDFPLFCICGDPKWKHLLNGDNHCQRFACPCRYFKPGNSGKDCCCLEIMDNLELELIEGH